MSKYAIGIDYGTLSVRALLVNIETGEEVAASIYEYPHGVMEEHIPSGKKLPVGWRYRIHKIIWKDYLLQ